MQYPNLNVGPSISSMKPPIETPVPRKRPMGSFSKQNELLYLACILLEDSNEEEVNDQCTYGKVWDDRNLHARQRIFAEMAINDVLFAAVFTHMKPNNKPIVRDNVK